MAEQEGVESKCCEPAAGKSSCGRAGWLLALVLAGVTFLLGLLGASIMERRWEAQRPAMVLQPIADWEPRNEVWGQNYPREFETYSETAIKDTKTKFGGSYQWDYLQMYPRQVILFAGYGFSRDYKQARGHYWSRNDVLATARTRDPVGGETSAKTPATCWTCKSTDVPRIMDQGGVTEFYGGKFKELVSEVNNPIGCQDCHDPKTMNLRITRPALREAFKRQGRDIDKATNQEMRSLVCAQCHVEYYFKGEGKYLTFPWDEGLSFEQMEKYYDDRPEFRDYLHAISKTRIVKMQHPDFEVWSTGVHAYRGVSCADCHMPYRTEGGVKFTDHHVQSPLQNVANSCGVCHRWGEEEIRIRVEDGQEKILELRLAAEDALVKAHFDVAAAMEVGATDKQLEPARALIRKAHMRWDYISASNGMGFHSPQESSRILALAIDLAQQARLEATRVLAARGVTKPPAYPDISTRRKAKAVVDRFLAGKPPKLVR